MATHNTLGKSGEEAATTYLTKHEYVIRHRNWRKGRLELDIVAAKNNELIIVEVKTRKDTQFAMPQDAVTQKKIKHTVLAADAYMKVFQIDNPVRFDIITVIGDEGSFKIEHIKEAFYPPIW